MTIKPKKLIEMYRKMLEIRYFERKAMESYTKGLVRGYLHLYIGEEAIAVGACSALEKSDYITSTHRGHGHCIAKGGKLSKMMAELLAKETGYCKGRGGSMHIADVEAGILGANGIVGGGIPIAVGAALASKLRDTKQVTLCFFGEGATNGGIFHESLNFAAVRKLPVVFICENNLYAVSTFILDVSSVANIADRAKAYGLPGIVVDGNDVLAVYETVKRAVKRARDGKGSALIEAKTYRWTGHHINDPAIYRTKKEVIEWKKKDPIKRFKTKLIANGILSEGKATAIQERAIQAVNEAVKYAQNSAEPSADEFLRKIQPEYEGYERKD